MYNKSVLMAFHKTGKLLASLEKWFPGMNIE